MSTQTLRRVGSKFTTKDVVLYNFGDGYSGESINVYLKNGVPGALEKVRELIELHLIDDWEQIKEGEYYLFVEVGTKEEERLTVISRNGRDACIELEGSGLAVDDDTIKIHVTKIMKDRQPGESPDEPMSLEQINSVSGPNDNADDNTSDAGANPGRSGMNSEIDSDVDSDGHEMNFTREGNANNN